MGRRSALFGPQEHRLPPHVMWTITFLTAAGMALINFATILAIECTVHFKFGAMQSAIRKAGIGLGVVTLTGISAFYALIGVCIIQLLAPNCGGSGLPENKCYLNGSSMPGLFTKRTLGVRTVATVLSNAAGFPVGREGPTVTIGSNLAYIVSKALVRPYVREAVDLTEQGRTQALLVDEQRFSHATRIACAVGGACAMGAIFNAPFGGFLYMFEEITSVSWPLELTFRVFVATMSSSLLSYGLCSLIHSDFNEYVIYAESPQIKEWHWSDVPIFVVVAALLGVITSLHTRAMLAVTAWRQRTAALWQWRRCSRICETVLYAAFCALLSAGASLLGTCTKDGSSGLQYVRFNCGEGEYNQVASLLVTTSHSSVKLLFSGNNAGEIQAGASILAFLAYFALNVGLSGLPVPGGAFTATMVLGGLFGRSVGAVCRELGLSHTVSGVYAIVGSAAMLCGFKQMTLAAVLIVVECVNDLTLAPIVMLGVAISMSVNWRLNRHGHDDEQILRKDLPHLDAEVPHELDGASALDLCDPLPDEAILPPEASIAAVRRALHHGQVGHFPVQEGASGPCLGIVARPHLEAALQAAAGSPQQGRVVRGCVASEELEDDDGESAGLEQVIGQNIPRGDVLPLSRIMDPSPFTVAESMPAPRLYALFTKAGENAVCVASIRGDFLGIISRTGLISASRQGVHRSSRSAHQHAASLGPLSA